MKRKCNMIGISSWERGYVFKKQPSALKVVRSTSVAIKSNHKCGGNITGRKALLFLIKSKI